MRILFLGGTRFLGRALVVRACRVGLDVTLFHRGEHPLNLNLDVTRLTGNRKGDLASLRTGRWDWVIDTSGTDPEDVRATCKLLSKRVSHYVFFSSISVYEEFAASGTDETAARVTIGEDEKIENFAAAKSRSEDIVRDTFPARSLVVRPGLLAGPHDPTDRFTYWVWRFSHGGRVLCPGSPDRKVQILDVRDLADWVIESVLAERHGTFNATSPLGKLTLGEVFAACPGHDGSRPVWVPDRFLKEHEVTPFTDLPLWLPEEAGAMFRISSAKAEAAGLHARSVSETAEAVREQLRRRGPEPELEAGLKPNREQSLLEAWDRDRETGGRHGGA